jgi:hypothetical protein
MGVRRKALDAFSIGVLPPQRQVGEIEARLVPVYLLHRYQLEAVARLLGGVTYAYSEAADRQAGTRTVAAERQRAALNRLVASLEAEQLALPANVLDLVTPPGNEYSRTREYFGTASGPMFDPFAVVGAAAAQTTTFLFAPERLNRLAWQHARDVGSPGVAEVLEATFHGTWQRKSIDAGLPAGEAVQAAANWVVLDALLATLETGKLHAQVAAGVRDSLQGWQTWLADNAGRSSQTANRKQAAALIGKYLADPKSVVLRKLPPIPPGAPI